MNSWPIGVMQGRLSPKYCGHYQAHPAGYWQDEFPIAAGLGLELIEFVFDQASAEQNPLMRDSGVDEILAISEKTGVKVRSVCADYFMTAPLHGVRASAAQHSVHALETLIRLSARLGVRDIVIPCVDESRFKNQAEIEEFTARLRPLAEIAGKHNLRLALETDLAPEPFAELLEKLDSPAIAANYDLGNSAAMGHDPEKEFAAYGRRISHVHVKDRTLGGGSVLLGSGAADFQKVLASLAGYDYRGSLIMQAFRDDEGLAIFRRQLSWFCNVLAQFCRTGAAP